MPRIRFHWMVRNINGLWSTIGTGDSDDDKRTVGNLLAEPRLSLASERVLEVLYCECCGAQMLTGFRIPIDNRKNHELANFPAILENMPDEAPETRTDSQTYKTLGVIYLLPEGQMTDATLEWSHGSIALTKDRRLVDKANAQWRQAVVDPHTAIVTAGRESDGHKIPCLSFELDADAERHSNFSAMPQVCPNCRVNYSERRGGKRSPIRAFATGLTQISLLLTKHLMMSLPELLSLIHI